MIELLLLIILVCVVLNRGAFAFDPLTIVLLVLILVLFGGHFGLHANHWYY